jgi:hypothetical protein
MKKHVLFYAASLASFTHRPRRKKISAEKEQNKIENDKRTLLLKNIASLVYRISTNGRGEGALEFIQGHCFQLTFTTASLINWIKITHKYFDGLRIRSVIAFH